MNQLQAGFVLDSVYDFLIESFDEKKVKGLLNQLSYFELKTYNYFPEDFINPNQILFVLNNIISRGLPTRISLNLEEKILNEFKLGTKNEKYLEIGSIK